MDRKTVKLKSGTRLNFSVYLLVAKVAKDFYLMYQKENGARSVVLVHGGWGLTLFL